MNSTQKLIKNKMGLLNLAEELGNVSKACKVMGFSRDTFYRNRELVDEGGIENLVDKTRRKANHKNRIDQTVEDAVNAIAIEFPAFGQVRASNELRKKGVFNSAAGVRCASDDLISETKPAEQAVNSLEEKSAETAERQAEKKAPVNKRAYTDAECAKIIEMINAGKTFDEIHQETKRSVLSLKYKFFNPRRGVKMCRDVEELKKFFPDS